MNTLDAADAQSADAALAQCRDRNYAARFAGENRPPEFYKRNGFAKFDSRVSKVDGKTYDMMFRFLSMS